MCLLLMLDVPYKALIMRGTVVNFTTIVNCRNNTNVLFQISHGHMFYV